MYPKCNLSPTERFPVRCRCRSALSAMLHAEWLFPASGAATTRSTLCWWNTYYSQACISTANPEIFSSWGQYLLPIWRTEHVSYNYKKAGIMGRDRSDEHCQMLRVNSAFLERREAVALLSLTYFQKRRSWNYFLGVGIVLISGIETLMFQGLVTDDWLSPNCSYPLKSTVVTG